MLAERFAKLADSISVTARLTLAGEEITTPGYQPQTVTFKSQGNTAVAAATFTFTDRVLFDSVVWSDENGDVLRVTKMAVDGPRGSHTAELEVEVGD